MGSKTWAGEWRWHEGRFDAGDYRRGYSTDYPSRTAGIASDDGWKVWGPDRPPHPCNPDESGPETGSKGQAMVDAALRRLGGLPDWTREAPPSGDWFTIQTNNSGRIEPVRIISSEGLTADGWPRGDHSSLRYKGRMWAVRQGRRSPYLIPDETEQWLFWPVPLNLPPPPEVKL